MTDDLQFRCLTTASATWPLSAGSTICDSWQIESRAQRPILQFGQGMGVEASGSEMSILTVNPSTLR